MSPLSKEGYSICSNKRCESLCSGIPWSTSTASRCLCWLLGVGGSLGGIEFSSRKGAQGSLGGGQQLWVTQQGPCLSQGLSAGPPAWPQQPPSPPPWSPGPPYTLAALPVPLGSTCCTWALAELGHVTSSGRCMLSSYQGKVRPTAG